MATSFRVYLQETPGIWTPATFEAARVYFNAGDVPPALQQEIPAGKNPYVGFVTTGTNEKLQAFMHATPEGIGTHGKACTKDGKILSFQSAD